ncbi:MAG TPA: TolC family protein [Polyangia bacterium]|nr:TolC family protein [Polyangia bacterium]
MRATSWGSIVLVAVVVVAGASVARADAPAAPPPTPISLHDAIVRAVAGNVTLLKQNVALRSAEGGVVGALGAFDVVLAADGTFSHNVSPPLHAGDVGGGSTNSGVFDLSLSRALESGGNLTLALQGRGVKSSTALTCGQVGTAMLSSCPIYSPSANLTFTQPLLRGFGREITEANLYKARVSRDLALLNRQAQAANTIRDTIIAYWELAYETQDLEIQRFSESLAREQLRTTEEQIKVGKLGDLAAASLKRAIATAQQGEASAVQALTGRALDLQRLMGAGVPRAFAGYAAADGFTDTRLDVDVDAETDRAIAASPALKSIRMGLELSQTDLRVALDSMRPQLNFVGTIGDGGRSPEIRTGLSQAKDPANIDYSAGFTFSFPIQNRAARGAADVAHATADSAQLDARDLELQIRDTVARMAAQIRAAAARVDFGRVAVNAATDNLTAEQARFQVGTSTNNDVLLRQQELKQAQESVARATADLLEGEVALAAVTGDVLDQYGVVLR